MTTIPDLVTKIRMILKKTIDIPYSWIETIGSKLSVWAWQKDGETERTGRVMDPNKFELYLYLGFFITIFMLLYAYLFI